MKKLFKVLVSALLCFAMTVMPIAAEFTLDKQNSHESRELAEGVTLTHVTTPPESVYNIQNMNILEFDPSQSWIHLNVVGAGEYANDRAPVSTMIENFAAQNPDLTPVAAVNGDLWMMGSAHARVEGSGTTYGGYGDAVVKSELTLPRGFNIYGGEIICSAYMYTETPYEGEFWSFGITDEGQAVIGCPTLDITATSGDAVITVDGFNRLPANNSLVLYSDKGCLSNYALDDAYELLIDCGEDYTVTDKASINGTVIGIYDQNTENNPTVSEKTMILTARGNAVGRISDLELGANITFDFEVGERYGRDVEKWRNVTEAVGGHMPFVVDGVKRETGVTNGYPSTIVGIKNDGTLIVVADDGRQSGFSRGLDFNDYAYLADELDINTGMILDGGGSTDMVILDGDEYKVVNRPSDGRERSVINSVIVSVGTERMRKSTEVRTPNTPKDITSVYFDGGFNSELVQPNIQTRVTQTDEGLLIQADKYNGDIYFNIGFGFPNTTAGESRGYPAINIDAYPYIVLDMKAVTSDANAMQFQSVYVSSGDRWAASGETAVGFNNLTNDGEFHRYIIDTTTKESISGQLNLIRIGYLLPVNGVTVKDGDGIVLRSVRFAATAEEAQEMVDEPFPALKYADFTPILTVGKDETSRNVTWMMNVSTQVEVQWADASDYDGITFPEKRSRARATLEKNPESLYTARALISDLKAESSYVYRVGSDVDGWSKNFTFKTGKFNDNNFSFIFIGDAQIGAGIEQLDAKKWNDTLTNAQNWFGDRIEFIMSAGDQTDDAAIHSQYTSFIAPDSLRSIPLITNVGNHDNASNYSYRYTFTDTDTHTTTAGGARSGDYWVAHDGALIMSLNSNGYNFAQHRDFIARAIDEYTSLYGEPNWKIVCFHHSLYSSAAERYMETTRRDALVPTLAEFDVDIVLTGHDHIYTRSYMIDNFEVIDDASRYTEVAGDPYGSIVDPKDGEICCITANSSTGSKYYGMLYADLPYVACKNQENTPNLSKIDVTADSLTIRTYRSTENSDISDVVDFFAIRRTSDAADVTAPNLDVPTVSYFYSFEDFDPLEGIFAYDNADGDVTSKIDVIGTLSKNIKTTITYSVTDSAGNTSTATRTLIPISGGKCVDVDTEWKYLDNGVCPFDINDADKLAWTRAEFDDSEWKVGVCAFGAREGELGRHEDQFSTTLLEQYYPDDADEAGTNLPNYFFRTSFDVKDPSAVDIICADLRYDDAVDIYINGVKIAAIRTDYVQNLVSYSFIQSGGDAASGTIRIEDPKIIASLDLKPTGNILAVELFQSDDYSEDIFFKFENLYIGKKNVELPFIDVPKGSWFYDKVESAYALGLFAGTSATEFSPDMQMTRAMAWTVLARIAGVDVTSLTGNWYDKARAWAIESGTSDGTNPNALITREQMATMLYAFAGKPTAQGSLDAFNDKADVSAWAENALVWAVSNGLLAGRGNGMLAPKANTTRAEACTILVKYLSVHG